MTHGVICSLPHERFGYFGWPSVARLDDGTLVVAASGYRTAHVCPWGKTVLCFSEDDGATWSPPRIVNDTPLDDRDAGVLALGGLGSRASRSRGDRRLLLTWFTRDTRPSVPAEAGDERPDEHRQWKAVLDLLDDETLARWLGYWVRISPDGGATWEAPVPIPLGTPHGPIRRAGRSGPSGSKTGGDLLMLGKVRPPDQDRWHGQPIRAARSEDGITWQTLGDVPLPAGVQPENVYEPHVVECTDGRLVGMIRYQHVGGQGKLEHFSLLQTDSADGGRTWTPARPIGVLGSPPHLLRHSSGTLVCVYGYRREPFGQRAIVSRDDGRTWSEPIVLRDDGPSSDLGYPASVELPSGELLTVYYQQAAAGENCGLLYTRWRLRG